MRANWLVNTMVRTSPLFESGHISVSHVVESQHCTQMDGKLHLRIHRHRSRSYKLCRQRHLKFSKMPGIQGEAGLPHGAESRDGVFCLDLGGSNNGNRK